MANRLTQQGLPLGLVLLLVMGLIAVVAMNNQVSPVLAQEVPSEAEIVAQANAPIIECKWELPDMQPTVADASFPDGDIQYGTAANPHQHDDDALVAPASQCERTDPNATPSQVDGITHMIQVRPLAHTDPNGPVPTRFVQLWAAVDHPNSLDEISDVYWKIYEPLHDGQAGQFQFKAQVHGTKVGVGDFQTRIAECGNLGSSSQLGTMFEAAVDTGQLTADAVDNPDFGLVAKCQQNEKALYYARFEINKDQSCGQYRVDLHAVSNGAESVRSNFIDVICYIHLNMDFTDVDWGQITPGRTKILSGNLIFSQNDGAPTLHNGANRGIGVSVHFDEMKQVDANGDPIAGAKIIDKFDACFGKSPSTIQCIGQPPDNPIPASQVTDFDDAPQRVLCANENGKLDLSIHPDSSLPAGTYAGKVEVIARPIALLCPKDRDFPITPTPITHTLTLNVVGPGSVSGGGTYDEGNTATVTATPDAGATFDGWSGPNGAECATGSVLMDADKECTATFSAAQVTHTLTLNVVGPGSVGGDGTYNQGDTASVTATPDAGATFDGWSGPNGAECATGSVLMDADKECTATFSLIQFTLTLNVVGPGTVTGDGTYNQGETAAVTATPDAGAVFDGWSGSNGTECATGSVLMDADKQCTANFRIPDVLP